MLHVSFMAKAVPFVVFPPGCRVCVEVGTGEAGDRAVRIQQELLGNLELPTKGAWHMLETWKGCGRYLIRLLLIDTLVSLLTYMWKVFVESGLV